MRSFLIKQFVNFKLSLIYFQFWLAFCSIFFTCIKRMKIIIFERYVFLPCYFIFGIIFLFNCILAQNENKVKSRVFCLQHHTKRSILRVYTRMRASTMKYLRARRIYDLLKTGSLFLFSYLLFVFFRGLRSSLLSLTARINPDGAVKEFSRN